MHQVHNPPRLFWQNKAAQKWPWKILKASEVFKSLSYENLVLPGNFVYDVNKLAFFPFRLRQQRACTNLFARAPSFFAGRTRLTLHKVVCTPSIQQYNLFAFKRNSVKTARHVFSISRQKSKILIFGFKRSFLTHYETILNMCVTLLYLHLFKRYSGKTARHIFSISSQTTKVLIFVMKWSFSAHNQIILKRCFALLYLHWFKRYSDKTARHVYSISGKTSKILNCVMKRSFPAHYQRISKKRVALLYLHWFKRYSDKSARHVRLLNFQPNKQNFEFRYEAVFCRP